MENGIQKPGEAIIRQFMSPLELVGPPETALNEDLKQIIKSQGILSLLDDFHSLTGMVTAILDLEGNVLQSTGWRGICTRFHRAHPESSKCCTESDLHLGGKLKPGEYLDYRCRNGLRDVVTPLYVGSRHLGNIYTGQFFYDDDDVDEEQFREQARRYGFDEEAYMAAFREIPRYPRATIDALMSFLIGLTANISRLSLANTALTRELKDRRRIIGAWQESEIQLKTLIRTLPDLVWLKDPDGVYLFCNSRFEDFFGAPVSEIVGRKDSDFMDREMAEFFRGKDLAAIENNGPTLNEEWITFRSDGHKELLETIKTPMFTPDGNLLGVLGIGRDITGRRQAETALREHELQIHRIQQMETIGRLAGSVAHDLNNLLTPIIGHGQLLANDPDADDPRRSSTNAILGAGIRARDLVRRLLTFGNRQPAKHRAMDLARTVRDFMPLLQQTVRDNIEIEYDLASDPEIIMGDTGQIEQVLLNLVLNASDAMRDGGKITVSSRTIDPATPGGDSPSPEQTGPVAVLSVTDTGVGMDAQTLEHIFEPFYTTKGEKGNGLGLATVDGIVRQHGGEVRVTSEPGQGTTIEIHLPAIDAQLDEESSELAQRDLPVGEETVLLVEDCDDVRDLAYRILSNGGYRPLVASNGQEALDILANDPEVQVDLLLTDMLMPGITGPQLYEKAREARPGLKVLYMSGYSEEEMTDSAGGGVPSYFVQKPFSLYGLTSSVRSALDRS